MSARRAFTFVEILLVMTIISILAAIAVPNFIEAKARATVSRTHADLALVKMGIEAYRVEHRAYPLNRTPGQTDPADLVVLTTPIVYLGSLPIDVFTRSIARGERHVRAVTPEPYRYLNGVQLDAEAGLRISGPAAFRMGGVNGRFDALLWGTGPGDSLRAVPPEGPATEILASGEVKIVPYDPTNGTTSAGDIYERLP